MLCSIHSTIYQPIIKRKTKQTKHKHKPLKCYHPTIGFFSTDFSYFVFSINIYLPNDFELRKKINKCYIMTLVVCINILINESFLVLSLVLEDTSSILGLFSTGIYSRTKRLLWLWKSHFLVSKPNRKQGFFELISYQFVRRKTEESFNKMVNFLKFHNPLSRIACTHKDKRQKNKRQNLNLDYLLFFSVEFHISHHHLTMSHQTILGCHISKHQQQQQQKNSHYTFFNSFSFCLSQLAMWINFLNLFHKWFCELLNKKKYNSIIRLVILKVNSNQRQLLVPRVESRSSDTVN